MTGKILILAFFLICSISTVAFAFTNGELLSTIDRWQSQGSIDKATSLYYLACTFQHSDLLPAELQRLMPSLKRIDGTGVLLSILDQMPTLSPQDQERIKAVLPERPYSQGSTHSSIYPAEMHYENEEQMTYTQTAIQWLDHCWQFEVDNLGFIPPPADYGAGGDGDYDVYLVSGGGYACYTVPESSVPETWWYDKTSYIVMAYPMPENYFKPTLAHEFQHALQMACDYSEETMMEAGACFMEEQVYDECNYCYEYGNDFQDNPYCPLDYWKYYSGYQYTAFIYWEFIKQNYFSGDPHFYTQLYLDSLQGGSENEPDIIDILNQQLAAFGDSFDDCFEKFSQWRYFLGDNYDAYHCDEDYPYTIWTMWTHHPEDYPVYNEGLTENDPYYYGSDFVVFYTGDGSHSFTVGFTGNKGVNWRADLMGIRKDSGPPDIFPISLNEEFTGSATVADWAQYDHFVLVAINCGDGSYDPDQHEWTQQGHFLYCAYVDDDNPVTLTDFTATPEADSVTLTWRAQESEDHYGYNLYRTTQTEATKSSTSKNFVKLNDSLIVGNTPYSFVDNNVEKGKTYIYRLEAVKIGTGQIEAAAEDTCVMSAYSFAMANCFPNPADAYTNVNFSIPESMASAQVTLSVYDLSGRLVTTVAGAENYAPGLHNLKLDTTGWASGVYSLKLTANSESATTSMVVTH